jgi:hypothetical protein
MEVTTKNYVLSISDHDGMESYNGYVFDSIDEITRFKEGHRVYGVANIANWSRFKKIDWHYPINGSKPLDGIEFADRNKVPVPKKYSLVKYGSIITKWYL